MSDTESDDEFDADLAKAVALSLQNDISNSADPDGVSVVGKEIVDLISSDEEDDDLDAVSNVRQGLPREDISRATVTRTTSANLNTSSSNGGYERIHDSETHTITQSPISESHERSIAAGGIAGLDRKQMEKERLERSRKRKASVSPPSVNRDLVGHHDGAAGIHKKQATSEVSTSLQDVPKTSSLSKSVETAFEKPSYSIPSYRDQQERLTRALQFPHGVVKKTWAYGQPRMEDIKIEEILQKNDLELAVLSAFQWDDEWILSKLRPATKILCVIQAEDETRKENMRKNAPDNIRFCFPSMAGNINCMHSKLMLLSHPQYLRIAVPSANLVPYDWGESGGVMENTVFIIDLPRLAHSKEEDALLSIPFKRELLRFLQAQGMDEKVVRSLHHFDFAAAEKYAFVHSIGGSHSTTSWKHTGYCGLGTAIKELGLSTKDAVEIDLVSASIGSLNYDFLTSIYLAAKGLNIFSVNETGYSSDSATGDDGMTEYNWRNNRPPKKKNAMSNTVVSPAERTMLSEVKDHFRIYYPTRDTVARSRGGTGAGGTICFQPQWYDAESFPRTMLRDCESARPGMLMHNKMLFARLPKPVVVDVQMKSSTTTAQEERRSAASAWAYVGSANLSESAWGRLVKDRATKSPKLNCRNWECGVIVPVVHVATAGGTTMMAAPRGGSSESGPSMLAPGDVIASSMRVFTGIVPVPMVVPGKEYGDRRPWFYSQR